MAEPSTQMFDPSTGAEIEVPASQVAELFRSGRATFDLDAPVYVERGGRHEVVTGAEAAELFGGAQGLAVRASSAAAFAAQKEADEYGGLGGAVKAGAAGVARGLSFGLSDVAAEGLGYNDELEKLRRYNPGSSLVGEVGGAALPAFFSGGTSSGASGAGILARAGRAATTLGRGVEAVGAGAERLAVRGLEGLGAEAAGNTARVLSGGARMAAEGAFIGAGHAASEAALKGDDITVEKILAGGGMGAMFGGALGAGLGGIGVVAGGAVKGAGRAFNALTKEEGILTKVLGREVAPALDDLAVQKAISSLGPTQRMVEDLRALGPEAERRVAGRILDELPEAAGKKSLAQMTRKEAEAATETVRRATGREIGAEYKALDDALAAKGVDGAALKPAVGDMLSAIKSEVVQPLALRPGYDAGASAVARMVRTFEKAAAKEEGGAGFVALHRLRGDFGAAIQKHARGNPVVADAYRQAYGIITRELEKAGDAAAKASGMASFSAKIQTLNAKYADYRWMSDALKRGVAADTKNRSFGLGEALGAIRGSNVGSQMGAAVGSLAGPVGQAAGALVGGVAGSFVSAAFNHMVKHRGDQIVAVIARRAAQSDALRAITQTVDEVVDKSVLKALGRGTLAVRRGATNAVVVADRSKGREKAAPVQERYAQGTREVAAYVASQGATGRAATDRIRGAHPEIASALDAKALSVAQNVMNKVPPPAPSNYLTFGKVKPAGPSPSEMSSWLRYKAAALDPLVALEALADGKLAPEHVEALKDNYPPLLNEMRSRLVEAVRGGGGKEMPYDKRVQLGLLLDVPTDALLVPETLAAVHASMAAGAPQAGPDGAPAPGGKVGKISFSKGAAEGVETRTQRLEGAA